MSTRYRDAGVDLDLADAVKSDISRHLQRSLFGGCIPVPQLATYASPVLVSSIDGIGTKVRLATLLGRFEGLGQDIVHHCVNDIAVHGASPLFFLDYLAFHRVDRQIVNQIVSAMANACEAAGAVLAGGETAEMPSVYPSGQFDVAGAIVGVAEQAEVVDGSHIALGDVLVGFPSSGLHTNGYSLVQQLFESDEYRHYRPELGETLGDALLKPHRSYLQPIQALLKTGTVHGMAHITGGGIAGNLSRIIPPGLTAEVELPPSPPLFRLLQEQGVPRDEMIRVFNMGIGLIVVCRPDIEERMPDEVRFIGRVRSGERSVELHDDGER